MHELSGKRVEVKSATPRGSGPVAGRGSLAEQRMWGPRPMGGRGMGSFPGQMSPQGFGMGGYGAVGWGFCQYPFMPHVIIPLLLCIRKVIVCSVHSRYVPESKLSVTHNASQSHL